MPVQTLRRVGDSVVRRGCLTGESCLDEFELIHGRFAVIGTDVTAALTDQLPPGASGAQGEPIVRGDHDTLTRAKRDIPDA